MGDMVYTILGLRHGAQLCACPNPEQLLGVDLGVLPCRLALMRCCGSVRSLLSEYGGCGHAAYE